MAVRGGRPLHDGVGRARRRVVDAAARPRPRVLRLVAGVPAVLQPLDNQTLPLNYFKNNKENIKESGDARHASFPICHVRLPLHFRQFYHL